jgi:hypothetical protein
MNQESILVVKKEAGEDARADLREAKEAVGENIQVQLTRPQTFFQGRAKIFQGGKNLLFA